MPFFSTGILASLQGAALQTVAVPAQGDWSAPTQIVAAAAGTWKERLDGAVSPLGAVEKGSDIFLYFIGGDGTTSEGGPQHRALGVTISTDGGSSWNESVSNPILTFLPGGDGGSNIEEEGVFGGNIAVDGNGTFHLGWSGLTATDFNSVRADHYYSTSNDGESFTDNDAATANKIVDADDNRFSGLLAGGDDESGPNALLWNAADSEFEYYYWEKEGSPGWDVHHMSFAAFPPDPDNNNSQLAVAADQPQTGDEWRTGAVVERGNDNFDLFLSTFERPVLYRMPITSRDFGNPGAITEFYDFTGEFADRTTAVVLLSRTHGKWFMFYHRDNEPGDDSIYMRTADIEFVTDEWPSMIDFIEGNTSRHYTSASGVSLTSPWMVGARTRVGANAGSDFQQILGNSSGVFLALREAGASSNQNKWFINTTNTENIISTDAPGADGLNRLIVWGGDSNGAELYFCLEGGSASLQGTHATAVPSHSAATWYVGSNDTPDRFYGEEIADLFVANRKLTTQEIEDIAAGQTPTEVLGAACVHWWKFNSSLTTVPDEVGGIDFNRQGTGW